MQMQEPDIVSWRRRKGRRRRRCWPFWLNESRVCSLSEMLSSPTQPGAIETAVEDLRGHITQTSGETVQGFWLLTEWVYGCVKKKKRWGGDYVSSYHWDKSGDKFVNRTLLGFVYGVLLIFFSPARQGSFSWLNGHVWLQLWSFWAGTSILGSGLCPGFQGLLE